MGNKVRSGLRLFVIGCVSLLLAGCSISNPTNNPFTWTANANGKPTVWECSPVRMASPPQYACCPQQDLLNWALLTCDSGKTYTAFQLRDFRLGTDTNTVASKY
jgi:hypothetical protein